MSTYYGLHCKSCELEFRKQGIEPKYEDTHSGCFLRSQDHVVESMIPMAPHIAAIRRMDEYGYITIDLMGDDDGGTFDFLASHAGHFLEVYSEYRQYFHYGKRQEYNRPCLRANERG